MSEESKMICDGVEVKVITGADGSVVDLERPAHLRPDIEMGEDWYEDMMLDIRTRLIIILSKREQSIHISNVDIDEMTWEVHAQACWLACSEPKSSGSKGGRPRDTGAEVAARSALDIAEYFNLPGRGIWEESVSVDLLNLIENIAREYKGRLKPISFKPRYRLEKGKQWRSTPWGDFDA